MERNSHKSKQPNMNLLSLKKNEHFSLTAMLHPKPMWLQFSNWDTNIVGKKKNLCTTPPLQTNCQHVQQRHESQRITQRSGLLVFDNTNICQICIYPSRKVQISYEYNALHCLNIQILQFHTAINLSIKLICKGKINLDTSTYTLAWGFFLEKSQARPRSEIRTWPCSSNRILAGCGAKRRIERVMLIKGKSEEIRS